MTRGTVLACVLLCVLPATLHAHGDGLLEPHHVWTAWSIRPALILPALLGSLWYALGVRVLWRNRRGGRGLPRWRVVCFAAGMIALMLALVSPIDALGEVLFVGHMVQHMLLMTLAAPLIALGAPLIACLAALPRAQRRMLLTRWRDARPIQALAHALTRPVTAWMAAAVTLWFWHAPGPYDAAISSNVVHALEHASFLGTALLFWWPLADPAPRRRLGYGWGVLYVFTACMQGGVLGALLTFSRTPFYSAHLETTAAWGLTPLEDQQLAGVVMWFPGGLVYLAALLTIVALWLQKAERIGTIN
jgi:putative membrane protein